MAESLISLTNSLERATQLTKYLPSAANQQEISAIYASLRDTQQSIQNFLQQQERQLALSENSNISAYSRGGEEQAMVEDEEGDQQMPATVEDEEVERLQETMKENRGSNPRTGNASSISFSSFTLEEAFFFRITTSVELLQTVDAIVMGSLVRMIQISVMLLSIEFIVPTKEIEIIPRWNKLL
ncbi:hypothetical protein SUGI_1186530 [Cryptomeria japonica]|nr:hypothetical protein SUGI_1186530 [Cryptomeria japonica]